MSSPTVPTTAERAADPPPPEAGPPEPASSNSGVTIRQRSALHRFSLSRNARYGVVGLVAVTVLWELLPRLGILDSRVIPPPSALVETVERMVANGFLLDIRVTMQRAVLGLLVGGALGIAVGMASGLSKSARAALGPVVAVLYPIPTLVFLPVILTVFGNATPGWIALIASGPFFTMAIVSRTAFRDLGHRYLEVGAAFGASRLLMARSILLPGAMPGIMGGLKLSLGASLMSTVAVEYLLTPNGVGQVLWDSWNSLLLRDAMVALATTSAMALISYAVLAGVDRIVMPWKSR